MEPVVIKFTEQGLEDIEKKLLALGAIDEKAALEFKKANVAFSERKASIDSTTTSMESFSKAAASAQKNIASGATNEAIKQTGQLINKTTEDVKKYDASLKGLKKEYKDLVAEAIKVGENTPFGDELLKKAGEVKDRIDDIQTTTRNFASDTATFNAIGQGIRSIGAGFEIAQGAQALFGKGNEDLEKQLVKIQATMALVNGLTEVQEALQRESALRLGIMNALEYSRNLLARVGITFRTEENAADAAGEVVKKRVVAVQAVENGLQSKSIIIRGAATAAQWLLNNAMLAFPLIAVIAGLTAVIALLGGFGDALAEDTENQIKLNEVEKENLEIMRAQDELINKLSSDRAEAIARDIQLLQAQRASTEEIRSKENQLQQERNRNAQFQAGNHFIEIGNLEKNRLAVVGLTAALASYNKAKAESGDDTFDKSIEAIKGKLEIVQDLVKQGEDAQKNAADAVVETSKLALDQQKERELEGLAFQKDIISAKMRFAKEASEQQFSLQLAAAKNERDTQIANLKASNDSRADIEAAYLEKVAILNETYNNAQLQKRLDIVNAEMTAVRVGSNAELDLKLKAIEIENQMELNNRKLTDEKRRELVAVYLKKVNDMLADFAKKQKDDELNAQLLLNDAKLQLLEKGTTESNAKTLQLKQQALALQEQLELNGIDRNIQGTELGEAKKTDIVSRYAAQRKQLDIDAIEVIIKANQDENHRLADIYQSRADLEAANVNTSFERRQQLQLEAFDNKITLLEKDKQADIDRYLAGELSYEQFQKRLTEIQDEETTIRQEKQNAADQIWYDNLNRRVDKVVSVAGDSLNTAEQITQANLERQLDALNKEMTANEQLHNQKKISDNQYLSEKQQIDRKILESKKKAAQQEHDLALYQIALNTIKGAISAFADTNGGYIAKAGAAALALAFGAIEYGIAASKPIPGFEKGTENAPKGWAWVGEKGPELIWMKGGEKVKTHEESKRMSREVPTLRNSFASHVDRSPVPSDRAQKAMQLLAQAGGSLDVTMMSKMIGQEIGSHISQMPITHFSFDKNGFRASIAEGNGLITFLNDRFSSI